MKRRSFFSRAAGTIGAIGLLSLPSYGMQKKKMIKGKFIHMVFFWLKDTTEVDAFISSMEDFVSQVDEVKKYHFGKPAGTPREVVDNSYQASLVLTFDSKEDQDAYQKHPIHVQFVEDHNEKWTKVQIYDSFSAL